MIKKSKLGFSLIELSITILVIGILVIGVTNGSRIIRETKLKSARALTISSPVNSIESLYMWFDSISEKSLDTNLSNGSLVSNWYDINSQSNVRWNLTAASTNRPVYNVSGINSLPTIQFVSANDNHMTNSNLAFPFGNYSIFIVFKPLLNDISRDIMVMTSGSSTALQVETQANGIMRIVHRFPYGSGGGDDTISSTNQFTVSNNYILSYIRNFVTSPTSTTVRLNNTTIINSTPSTANFDNSTLLFYLGRLAAGARYFDGHIGEVIVFNRTLKNYERQSVEQYLSNKWGTKLN